MLLRVKQKSHERTMKELERRLQIAKMKCEEREIKYKIFKTYLPFHLKLKFNKLIVLLSIAAIILYTIAAILLQNTYGANGLIANGGGVCEKSYLLSYKNIAGYGRPKYNDFTSNNNEITIDVSSYQKNIDWKKVKQSGINYAILRGVIKNGSLDSTFETNYQNAILNGIKILGVYQFLYALDENMAKNDAINMINKLNGKKLNIWLDLEWSKLRELEKTK